MSGPVPDWLAAWLDADLPGLSAELDRLLAPHVSGSDREALREVIEGVWWSVDRSDAKLRAVTGLVARTAARATGTDAGPPLALYLRLVCETAWDLTWDHAPLLALLDAVEEVWRPRLDGVDPPERLAVEVLLALRDELMLESAISTADLARVVHRAGAMEAAAATLAAPDPDAARDAAASAVLDALRTAMADRCRYAEAARLSARTVLDTLEGRTPGHDERAAVLARLHAIEHDLADDHASASEARAHRVAVESVLAAGDPERDWLRVVEGQVVYVFPFGIRHPEQSEVVQAVKDTAAGWTLGGAALGNKPTSLLMVDDCWRGDDPLNQRYEGTQLDLPDLELSEVGAQERRAEVTVLVSQLGNHSLRVTVPLENAMPHEIAARVWAAAPEHGSLVELEEPLRLAGGGGPTEGWARLSDYVSHVLDDLDAALDATDLPAAALPPEEGAPPASRRRWVSWRPGMFHVVTTVRSAERLPGGDVDAAEELLDARDLPGLFGAQSLCHPLPAGMGSIAPWTRYESPLGHQLHCAALTDDLILVAENHTLLASFTSADFMVDTVAQAVTFVIDLEGMFAAWQDELGDFFLRLRLRRLVEFDHDKGDLDALQGILAELQDRQLRLRQFLTSARVALLFVAAPALVTSPVVRRTVDDLLAISPVWQQRKEFTENAGQALADRVTDLIESWSRKKEEKLERRNRQLVNTILAVVAGIGISGVFAMVQDGFAVTGWGSAILVVGVLLLAGVVGVVAFRSENERRKKKTKGAG